MVMGMGVGMSLAWVQKWSWSVEGWIREVRCRCGGRHLVRGLSKESGPGGGGGVEGGLQGIWG